MPDPYRLVRRVRDRAYWNASPMNPSEPFLARAAFYCAFASATAAVVSIAAAQTLLALALAALLISGTRLRLPPIWLPLALFILGTVVSLLLSENRAAGWPQIRKLFVFSMLLVVFSTFRRVREARWLVLAWTGAGTLASLLALGQFWRKLEEARQQGRGFYDYYIGERITGFMSHWMTFSGLVVIVLLMLAAFVLFSPRGRGKALALGLAAGAALGAALVLGMTRSMWLAGAGGGLYLLWVWKRKAVLAAPAAVVLGLLVAPGSVRTRATSIFQPRQQVDSNQHRIVCWRTGWEMIRAHPWFGVGPEMVGLKFNDYVPPDIPRPLPTGWYGHLHNVYLHYAAERGLPVMLVLVWMLGKMLWDFRRAARALPPGPSDERFILHGAAAVVVATLISGLFELNLGDSEVLMTFLAVAACGYVAADTTPGAA